jgi:hypothetical protein
MGADSFKVFMTVTLPLIKDSFLSGFVTSFVRSITAISAIILLFSSGFKSKNAATTIAVLMGGKILTLTYSLISLGIQQIPLKIFKGFSLSKYMPDALMGADKPPVVRSLVIIACYTMVMLTLTVSIFNKKDVN